MPGFNPENINIHDLTIEDANEVSKVELPFDIEKDVTEEDWIAIQQKLEECRKNNQWERFSYLAKSVKVTDPLIDLNLDQTTQEGMEKDLEPWLERFKSSAVPYQADTTWRHFFPMAMNMKILNTSIPRRLCRGVSA